MDSENKKSEISFFNANITSIMSVALVLLLLGIVALTALTGQNLSTQIRENIGFNAIIKDDAKAYDINQLKKLWNRAEYVASVKYISKDDALKEWEEQTGENLIELLGVNPLNAEFDVKVKVCYAHTDSLEKIAKSLSGYKAIESIEMQEDLIDAINDNINSLSLILGTIAIILIIISFALINNTIHLSVYSRRFIIHTMKLVGAKASFIRRPFITNHIINGIIAGIIALVLLSVMIYYANVMFGDLSDLISATEIVVVYISLVIFGVILCATAAAISTNKYIRLDYDSLFKR